MVFYQPARRQPARDCALAMLFKVKELASTPARADCLRKGECDAVPLGQPEDIHMMKQGYRRLGVATDAMKNFQFIVSAVRRSWGEKNKDALVRYVRALASAYRFMRDPANRDEVVRVVIDRTGSTDEIAPNPGTLLRPGPGRDTQTRRNRYQRLCSGNSSDG